VADTGLVVEQILVGDDTITVVAERADPGYPAQARGSQGRSSASMQTRIYRRRVGG
jgi:hypothetical protein